MSDWISIEDPDQGYVKPEFAAPTPLGISEVEAYSYNLSSMIDYCRFTPVVLSFPPMEGVHFDFDFNIRIKHDDSGLSTRARY